jgi:hypothetical protein
MSWDWETYESNFRKVFQNAAADNYSFRMDMLTPNPSEFSKEVTCPHSPSLVSLCVKKIISYKSLSFSARSQVPKTLLIELVRSAVKEMKFGALEVLLEFWPYETFSLNSLHKHTVFDVCEELDVEDRKNQILDNIKLVITITNKVTDNLSRKRCLINTLDISGYPITCDFLFTLMARFKHDRLPIPANKELLTLKLDLYLTDAVCQSFNLRPIPQVSGLRIVVRNLYFSVTYAGAGKPIFWEKEYLRTISKLQTEWSNIFVLNHVEGLELSRLDLRSLFAQRGGGGEFFLCCQ